MSKTKETEWMVTMDEVFYYVGFQTGAEYGKGAWEFSPCIYRAYLFPTEQAAQSTLDGLTAGGDFKDTRGCVTPVTAFAKREVTRKDYAEMRKQRKALVIPLSAKN